MLHLQTTSNTELITYLTEIEGKLPSNEFLICITGTDEDPIVGDKFNILATCFDDEVYGPRQLSFSDGMRIFSFIKYKVAPAAQKLKNCTLVISCKDGLTRSGSIAEWVAQYVDKHLLDAAYYEEKNLLIEPSQLTLYKMYLVQMLQEHLIRPEESLPSVAVKLLETSTSSLTKKNCEDYLNALLINETKLLTRDK